MLHLGAATSRLIALVHGVHTRPGQLLALLKTKLAMDLYRRHNVNLILREKVQRAEGLT
jgi:hypothetical protein